MLNYRRLVNRFCRFGLFLTAVLFPVPITPILWMWDEQTTSDQGEDDGHRDASET